MRGSVRQAPNDTWGWVVDIPTSPGQPRRQMRRRGYRTKQKAEDALLEALKNIDAEHHADARVTVSDFAARWLPTLDLEPGTIAEHERYLKSFILPEWEAYRLRDLTTPTIEAWYRALDRSPWVVRRVHVTLRRMLSDAVRWGELRANPAAEARIPKLPDVAHHAITTREALDKLTAYAETHEDRWCVMWRVVMATGVRAGELCGMRWGDIDLDEGTVTIARVITRQNEVKPRPKTKAGRRTIPLDSETVAQLRQWRKQVMTEAAEYAGRSWEPDGYVWVWGDGERVRIDFVSGRWRRTRDRMGLAEVRMHDLRKAFGTQALADGVNSRVVQYLLGHSSVAVTLDVYSHVLPESARDAQRRIVEG